MTIPRYEASRFFVAFYRWSRYTRQSQQCALSNTYSRRSVRSFDGKYTRNYHTSRPLRQQEQPQPQGHDVDIQAKVDQLGASNAPRQAAETETEKNTAADDVDMEAEKLRNHVRKLMRKVPSSVAVITVTHFDPELKRNVPMGVAVSSLTTVTLDPPTMSLNIKEPSKTLDAIRAANGRFRIHFPGADREGASIIEHFCRGNHPDAYTARTKELALFVPGNSHRNGVHQASASNAPKLIGKSVQAAMECTLTHELPVADHVILVASIDNLECKALNDRTILYVDGSYMRPDGTKVTSHGKPVGLPKDRWVVWHYQLFPGESERYDYMKRIKTTIHENVKRLDSTKDIVREVESSLSLSSGAMGINLEVLVGLCRKEAGLPSELSTHLMHAPVLSEFYGRLSPSDRAKIVERARKLIKEDGQFLSLNYRLFLQYLGVSTASIDLLPSDILGPLRAEGLVGPFQPRVGSSSVHSRDYNLQYLEQAEQRLRDHFAEMGYLEAARTRLDLVIESLGEPKLVSTYFKKSRARLHSSASPELFAADKIDIAGHVSPEESRVIMTRIIHFLQVENAPTFSKRLNLDYNECLRRIGVHPCITGFNVEFFFGKIRHIHSSSRLSRDVSSRIDHMLQPWFDRKLTWTDLEARVKSFVHSMPHRAMSWSSRDKLAVMGLTFDAVLQVPIAPHEQALNRGHLLDTFVAKELKSLYASSADEEMKKSIALYLKQQYNYDVHDQPVVDVAENKLSGDDMQEAMKAHLNADALPGGEKKSDSGKTKGSWTSYSLDGEQR